MTTDTRTVNGVGWEIQIYVASMGWINLILDEEYNPIVFESKVAAEIMFEHMGLYTSTYRIYESLNIKPPKTKKWWEWWK